MNHHRLTEEPTQHLWKRKRKSVHFLAAQSAVSQCFGTGSGKQRGAGGPPPPTRREAGRTSLRGRSRPGSFSQLFPPGRSYVAFLVLFLAVLVLKPLLSLVTQEAPAISPRSARSQAVLSDIQPSQDSAWQVVRSPWTAAVHGCGLPLSWTIVLQDRLALPPPPSVASLLSKDWAHWVNDGNLEG